LRTCRQAASSCSIACQQSSSDTEITPMIYAVMEHMAQKGHKLLVAGQWSSGLTFWSPKIDERAAEYGWTYGVDYVNIGFKAGGHRHWRAIGQDFWKGAVGVDINGTPFEELPIMSAGEENRRRHDRPYRHLRVRFARHGDVDHLFPDRRPMQGLSGRGDLQFGKVHPNRAAQRAHPRHEGCRRVREARDRAGVATQLMDAQSLSHILVGLAHRSWQHRLLRVQEEIGSGAAKGGREK
jgi:hypothetical protein